MRFVRLNLTMANDFKDESPADATAEPSWSPDVTYFAELYATSLPTCDEFLAELRRHVDLLYGCAMTDHLNALCHDGSPKCSGFT